MLHGIRVVLVGILGVSTTSVCYPALQVSPAVTRLTVYRWLHIPQQMGLGPKMVLNIFIFFGCVLVLYSNSFY